MAKKSKNINVARLDISIQMLNQYIDDTSIEPFIATLEALKKDPESELLYTQFSEAFKSLGIIQGAILTYAPYVSILLSDDPFWD